jgi:succinoglycan biosynthesis protein ExoM
MNVSPAHPVTLAIIICTFHREALLAKALDSIFRQTCPSQLRVSVVVVDNSDDETAAAVVAQKQPHSPFNLRWMAAHPANISVARNAGVRSVDTEFVAFLDDDQEMQPGWLETVAAAVATYPHDVFFGAIESDFEAPERATPIIRQLFSRNVDQPAGSELIAMGPAKTPNIALATANSVFRRAAMLLEPEPFDLAYGNGGGEDYDLLCRMQMRGSRFAWLPGARAHEHVPADRCDVNYVRRRLFAGGQAYAAAVSSSSARPGLTRWVIRGKAAVQALVLLARWPLRAVQGRTALIEHSYVFAGVMGKLSRRDIYPLYRKTGPGLHSGR